MSAVVDDRNPTGFVPTQAQLIESTRTGYWQHFVGNSLQYYKAGRFAVAAALTPVSGNILHHAAEQMMKAALAHDDSLEKIRQYRRDYSHGLAKLWASVRERYLASGAGDIPPELDCIIAGLDRFERIRYPDKLIEEGATMSIGLFEVENPISRDGSIPENAYILMLPQIDRLMRFLARAANVNLEAFQMGMRPDDLTINYYRSVMTTAFAATSPPAAALAP
jgi:hypothetical protein